MTVGTQTRGSDADVVNLPTVLVCVLQAQHVFSPVMQGSARMMAPPTHGQPSLVSSSTTQYPEQTHTMYGTSVHHLCLFIYECVVCRQCSAYHFITFLFFHLYVFCLFN